ncbi:MAG: hypothetical protein ACAH83_17345 [Alphaproteobacteria bacterium]
MKHVNDQEVLDLVHELSKGAGKVMDSSTSLFLVQRILIATTKEKGILGAEADNDLNKAVEELRAATEFMIELSDKLIALQQRLEAAKSLGE